jgi:hypothetical protein
MQRQGVGLARVRTLSKLLITMCYKLNARRFGIPYGRLKGQKAMMPKQNPSKSREDSVTTPDVCMLHLVSQEDRWNCLTRSLEIPKVAKLANF